MKVSLFSVFAVASLFLLSSCNQEDATNKTISDATADAGVDGSRVDAVNNMDLNATQKADQRPAGPLTNITFEKYEHDFGNIKEGDVVEYMFKFTNTGTEPLVIESAKGSCGCTVPEFPKEPIAPGKGGEIKVKFNSQAKVNKQRKTVGVVANTAPENTTLTIVADVEPMPRAEGSETIRK